MWVIGNAWVPGQVIWEEMQGAIHAVDKMVTKTPAEAGL
jgi:hypothetical protein